MDITPFYELRIRLYLTAAAGCCAINEDFRLKRAVEAFAPLSEVNKAFGRFYAMCAKLFDSENTAADLADCIALADALAVTQATFADSCAEVLPYSAPGAVPVNAPFSVVRSLAEKIGKCKSVRPELTDSERELLADPRITAEFIRNSGMNSVYFEELSGVMFSIHGKSLVIMLKNAMNLSDPKATGMQIEYISRFAGAEENDWYLSLAENGELPQNVRVKAIEALACSQDNAEKLTELYQTEKGKLKNAALMALARLSPPEAEPIFKKLTEKYKATYTEYIAASSGEVCTEFAKGVFYETLEKNELKDGNVPGIIMLENKIGAEECFAKLAEVMPDSVSRDSLHINERLVGNLSRHSEPEYKELICRLYERYPEEFYISRFFLEFIGNPGSALETMRGGLDARRDQVLNIIGNIYYFPPEGQYRIPYSVNTSDFHKYTVPVFKSIPDSVLNFLTDTSFLDSREEKVGIFGKLAGKLKSEKKTSGADWKYVRSAAMKLMYRILKICSPADSERVREAAGRFALYTSRRSPNSASLLLLAECPPECSPGEYKGITADCVVSELLAGSNGVIFSYSLLDSFPLSKEEKAAEIKELIAKLESIKSGVSELVLKRQLSHAKYYLENLKRKEK